MIKHTLILTLFCHSILFSQFKMKSAEIDKSLDFILNKCAFNDDGNYYFEYLIITKKIQFGSLKTQGIGVATFDQNLNMINKFELNGDEKKESIIITDYYNKNVNLLTSYKKDHTSHYKFYQYNKKGEKVINKEVYNYDSKVDFTYYVSSDSTKRALIAVIDKDKKSENIKLECCVFDYNGSLLWKKSFLTNLPGNLSNVYKIALDNSGNVIAQINTDQDDKTIFKIAKFGKEKNAITSLKVPNSYRHIDFFEIQNELYLSGFNYDEKKDKFGSPFLVKVNFNEGPITVTDPPISESIRATLDKCKSLKKKMKWSPYIRALHKWKSSAGKICLVYEPSYILSERVGSVLYRSYYNLEYFIFTFDTTGKLENIVIAPKEGVADADYIVYPEYSFIYNDNLYAVYNEYEKNLNLNDISKFKASGDLKSIIRKIDLNGKISDTVIFPYDKSRYLLPNTVGHLGAEEFIFQSAIEKFLKFNDFRIDKITFPKK